MRSLYFRVLIIILYTILLSSLLGFCVSNVYYHWKLKPLNDAKLIRIINEIRSHAQHYPEAMQDYLSNVAAIGYQIYLVDRNKQAMFYGRPFRKTMKSSRMCWMAVFTTVLPIIRRILF